MLMSDWVQLKPYLFPFTAMATTGDSLYLMHREAIWSTTMSFTAPQFVHSRTCWQDIGKLVRDNNSATLLAKDLEQSTEVHSAYAWSKKGLRQLRSGCHLLSLRFRPWHPVKIHVDLQGISQAESTAYDWITEGLLQDILWYINCATQKQKTR